MATCCWNGLAWLALDSSVCGGSSEEYLGQARQAGCSWDLQNDSNLVLDLDHAKYSSDSFHGAQKTSLQLTCLPVFMTGSIKKRMLPYNHSCPCVQGNVLHRRNSLPNL